METALLVERGFAVAYITYALALIVNPHLLARLRLRPGSDTAPFLTLGFMVVFIGGFMVAAHNIWEWSPRLITTIIAWLALLKGFSLLAFPEPLLRVSDSLMTKPGLIRGAASFAFCLGLVIFYYSMP